MARMRRLRTMTHEEANTLRCHASEVIIRLFEAGEKDQLRLLFVTAQEAMRQIEDGGMKMKYKRKDSQ